MRARGFKFLSVNPSTSDVFANQSNLEWHILLSFSMLTLTARGNKPGQGVASQSEALNWVQGVWAQFGLEDTHANWQPPQSIPRNPRISCRTKSESHCLPIIAIVSLTEVLSVSSLKAFPIP